MTRYIAGNRYPFIVFDVTRGDRFAGPPYIPWLDTLHSMQVLNLLCESHHRVPDHWASDSERVPQHDGFIFRQDDGTEWHNQYPDYSNQQMSDENDWICHRSPTKNERENRRFIIHARDATKYLENLVRGVNELRNENPAYCHQLRTHLIEVRHAIDLVTGKSTIIVPYAVQPLDLNERLFVFDDWPKVKMMVPIET